MAGIFDELEKTKRTGLNADELKELHRHFDNAPANYANERYDYLTAPTSEQLEQQKAQKDADEWGLLDYPKEWAKGIGEQALGVVSGTLNAFNAVDNTNTLGSLADRIDAFSRENLAKTKQYSPSDVVPFNSNYYTNPQGATRDAIGMLGSWGALSALQPVLGAIGAGVANAIVPNSSAAMAGAKLLAENKAAGVASTLPFVGAWLASNNAAIAEGQAKWLQNFTNFIAEGMTASKVSELVSEGGSAAGDVRKAGGDQKAQADAFAKTVVAEMPMLAVTDKLEAITFFKNLGTKGSKEFLSGLAKTMAINGYEEIMQNRAQKFGTGEGNYTDMFNPTTWDDEDIMSGVAGALGAGLMHGGSKMLTKNNEQQETPDVDMGGTIEDAPTLGTLALPAGNQPLLLNRGPQEQQQSEEREEQERHDALMAEIASLGNSGDNAKQDTYSFEREPERAADPLAHIFKTEEPTPNIDTQKAFNNNIQTNIMRKRSKTANGLRTNVQFDEEQTIPGSLYNFANSPRDMANVTNFKLKNDNAATDRSGMQWELPQQQDAMQRAVQEEAKRQAVIRAIAEQQKIANEQEIGAVRPGQATFRPNVSYNYDYRSAFVPNARRALALQNNIRQQEQPSIEPTPRNGRALDERNFREITLPKVREQHKWDKEHKEYHAERYGESALPQTQLLSTDRAARRNMPKPGVEARSFINDRAEKRSARERMQDAIAFVWKDDPKHPLKSCRRQLNMLRDMRKEYLQPIYDVMAEGAGNGVSRIPIIEFDNQHRGRFYRQSNNSPWYAKYFKEHKKKPTQKAMYDIAEEVAFGENADVGYYAGVQGKELEAIVAENHEQLDPINDYIQTYESLELRLKENPNYGKEQAERINKAEEERRAEKRNAGETASAESIQTEAEQPAESNQDEVKEAAEPQEKPEPRDLLFTVKSNGKEEDNVIVVDIMKSKEPQYQQTIKKMLDAGWKKAETNTIPNVALDQYYAPATEENYNFAKGLTNKAVGYNLMGGQPGGWDYMQGLLDHEAEERRKSERTLGEILEDEGINADITVDDNQSITIEFSKKPSDEVRQSVKEAGYKWRDGAWKSKVNERSMGIAKELGYKPAEKAETAQGEKLNLPKGTTADVSIVGDNSNIIQVKFNGEQGKGTSGIMGRAGYKWKSDKQVWQARKTEKAMDVAEQLGYTEEAKPQERDYELERDELWDTFATKLGIDNILSVDKANEELKGVEGLHDGAIVYFNKDNRSYSIISFEDDAKMRELGYKYQVHEYAVNLVGTRVGSQKTVDEVIDYVKDKNTTETSTPTKAKDRADIFSKNPDALFNDKIMKDIASGLTPKQVTDIIQKMPKAEQSKTTKKQTVEKQTQEVKEPAKRFDGERARKSLDALIGRKKKSEPQKNDVVPKSKFMNVFNEDELDAEIEKAKKEMSKLSANPMFNPALMKSLFKVGGIYLQKGVNKFAAWADNMVDVMGEKVRPFLPAVWDSLKKYPDNQKFNDDVMTAVMEYVGEGVDNGKSLSAIKREFADDYGDEYLGYVDAAFEGVKKYPTSDNVADVVESKQDNTEGGKENGQRNGTSGEVGNSGLGSGEAEGSTAGNRGGQKVQTGLSGQTETRPRENGNAGAGRPGGHSGAMGVPASEYGSTSGERGKTADNGGTSLQQSVQESDGSGETEESGPAGEDAENGGRGELSSSVPRRRINKGSYSILENGNYHANNEDALLGNGKHEPTVRFSINLKAIEALRRWQEDGIEPTPEEKNAMAHYSGWGGMKKLLFEGTWENPEYASGEWKEANDKLRKALGKEAWETAWLNVSNQYYTPPSAIAKMWNLATRLGFKGGKVLEPSMGVGNFYALMPAKLQKDAVLTGVEIDPIAGEMAKVLYPDAHIFVQGYEKHAAPENFYDLIIGNVPFGENTLKDSKYSGEFADPLQIHDFFLVKNIGQLQPGGILMAITTHNSLDKINTTVRSHIAKKAELVGAIRLPNTTFNGTGTDVMTDLLVFKKRDKEIGIEEAIKLPWVKTAERKVRYAGEEKIINFNKYFEENPQMVAGQMNVKSGRFGPELGTVAANPSEAIDKAIENFPKNIMKKTKSKAENEYASASQNVKDRGLYYNSKGSLVYRDGIQEKKVTLEDYRYAKNESKTLLERRREIVNSLMGVYDKYSKLIEAENGKAPNLEQIRKEALEAFENHVNTYGYYVKYSKRKDGSIKTVFAKELRFFNDLGDAEKFIDLSALDYNNKPAPILLKKVTADYQMGAPTVANAYLKQLFNGNNNLDIAQLAKDANTTESAAIKELIDKNAAYKTPNGEYQPTNIYLSGNVVEKLKEAQAAYDLGDKSMKRNIDALTAVRPKLVSYVSITAKMGVPWVETKDYEDFIASLLNAQSGADIGVHVENKAGAWKVRIDSKEALESPYATEKYGMRAPFVDFTDFLEAAMNKKEVSIKKPVYGENGKIKTYEEDAEETKKAAQKIEQIQNAFANWLWNQDADRKVRMELAYNDTMNAIVPPVFDARLMQFDGLIKELNGKPFDPRIHQRNFVLRALLNGRGGAYHEAGTGKTLIMSMLCMELRRSGKAHKPLILAHNANAAQVAKDIKTFYPTSKVLYVPKFGGGKNAALTKRLIGQIKSGDWDAVVIPHQAIDKIAFSEETLKAIKNDELEAIKENIRTIADEEAEKSGKNSDVEELEEKDFELTDEDKAAIKDKGKGKKSGGKFLGDRTRRAMLQYKAFLLTLQQQAENYDKPDYIPFETMGIDAILVDECHVFKKAPKITKRQVKGVDTQTSKAGIKMSCLTDYINMKNNNKGVFLFSGTMITNTIPEIHTMMRFVMPDTLKKANIYNLDDFLNTFTGTTNDIEPTSDGSWEPVERLTQFYNITELKRIAGQDFDIVTTKGLPGFELRALPNGKTLESKNLTDAEKDELLNGRSEDPKGLPNFKIQNIVIPKTKRTKAISQAIQNAAQKWKKAKKMDKAKLQKEGYGLKLQTLPSAIGMSLRNLDTSLRDTPNSKVNMCVHVATEIYHSHPKACQVIFTEKGYSGMVTRTHNMVDEVQTPKGRRAKVVSSKKFELEGYNLVNDLKAKLIEQGVPENEIAVIDGSTSDDKRADIAERVSAAEIRIVIGSSQTLGVGVNMQRNLRAAHHLDAVWMPGDLEQMNKRSKRQGNCWNTVYSYRYIAPGYDGKMWSALSQKQAFISTFTDTENNIRIIDSDALSTGDGEDNASVNDIVETLTNAIDDVRVLQKAKIKNKLDAYADNEVVFRKSKAEAADEVKRLQEKEIPALERRIQAYKDDYKTYKDNKPEKFTCKIKTAKGWTEFTDRAKAESVLRTILKTSKNDKYCEYNGFRVTMEAQELLGNGYYLIAHGANGKEYSTASGTFAGLSQLLANIPKRISKTEESLKKDKETVKIKKNELNEESPYADIVDTLQKKLNAIEKDLQDNPVPAPEWFRLKVPIDTFVEYNGKNYLVTGYSVKYNDQPYSVIGTYVDEDGKEVEAKIPANEAMVDGFPVLTDEEMDIDPKKEILDETDDTPELQSEINKAVEAVDRVFSDDPYYRNPRKATLTIDGETIDITKDYQEGSAREQIEKLFPIGKTFYYNGKEITVEKIAANGKEYQIVTHDNGHESWISPWNLSNSKNGEPVISLEKAQELFYGNTQYSVSSEAVQRAKEEVEAEIRAAFPNGKVEYVNGVPTITMPNGSKFQYSIRENIVVNAKEQRKADAAHGTSGARVQGFWKKFTGNGVQRMLAVSQNSERGTAFHEAMHAAIDLVLTEKEKNALYNYYEKKAKEQNRDVDEVIADAYRDWVLARQRKSGTMFGKLWRKVKDFCTRIKALFDKGAEVERIMQDVESGRVYKRGTNNHSVTKRISFSKEEIQGQKGSGTTQVATTRTMYVKALKWLRNQSPEAKTVLDYGAGLGLGTDDMRSNNPDLNIDCYEPNPERWAGKQPPTYTNNTQINKDYDLILNTNVLNVVEKPIRDLIVKDIADHLNMGGKALITTRGWSNDVNAAKNFKPADEHHAIWINKGKNGYVFQKGFDSDELKNYIEELLGDEFVVEKTRPTFGKSSVTITRVKSSSEETHYSVAPAKHKIANAFTNTERKGVVDSAKDFFKEHRKSLYQDWFDKNNPLKGFDALTKATGGLSVYDQVQSLPATTAGMLKALTEGTAQHVKMANQHLKNVKMKYNVTLAMALEKIDKKQMDKAYPKYLAENGFDNWVNALGAYLGAERCLEMAQLARAEGKTYKFPKGLTEQECQEFVKKAPQQFKAAADIFYKVNDNVISIMEDAEVFSHDLAKTLRTKYRKYCPLLRDFSDTAAADSFIGGLTEGGRGIGNVSVPLKRINIEGSERGVLNPLETILKSYAVMLNRAERNKVALMAVENSRTADLHELIQEVPGTTADPKNCVFTVLINGKKKAYKTTQDLYGPIVGYNLPAANLAFGVARTAARMLRTGATMSPSFILRNVLRDTVFAGVSSKNGFIPIVDTIRGAIALAKDPAMRAEFEAAGVTEYNFYSSQKSRIKSLDAMAGETPASAWEIMKAVFSRLEATSDFFESSTRMGEYMKARQKGLSMEEAARAAREVTLDFSRSGRIGEQVNQVVPFFNACLQGGDKMVRLFREDPWGTAMKVTEYIILPSLLIMAMNWDEDWYKDLDPDIKNNYWCLGRNIRIPKPQEAGVLFGSGIEALFQQAADKDKDAVSNFLKAFGSNMIPSVLPTVILPLIEWSANYSFFKGRPLVGNKYSRLPDELQYNDYTSELSKGIGSAFKLSPMKIDNLVRGYTGTMGALLWSMAGEPFAKANNLPAKHFSELPFVRDFNVTDANLSRPMNEFYGILDKANRQHAGYGVKGKPEAAVKGIRSAGAMISKIRKDIDKITHSNLTPERKRELIDKRKEKMNQIAKQATARYGKYFE